MKKLIVFLLLFLAPLSVYSQTLSGTVEFYVNTDTMIKNEDYYRYLNEIVPKIKEDVDKIDHISLIGSASPEGNKKRNIYLANIRADKIYSYISDLVPKDKIIINNDYELFLSKTGCERIDYEKQRGAYIEVYFKKPDIPSHPVKKDTVFIRDTIRYYKIDTVWLKVKPKQFPILAIKTNVASDAILTPNIQAELYTWLWGLSLEFDYTFPWYHKDYDKYFYYQILNGTAGIRKYFNNKYTGHWIGIYANTAIYDICFWNKDKGWQGEVYGAGIGYGYVFQSKKYPRFKFEPYIRLGWFNTKFDTYHVSQPWNEKYYYNWYSRASDFVPRRFNMNYFGPTEIGINITFDLICVRKY